MYWREHLFIEKQKLAFLVYQCDRFELACQEYGDSSLSMFKHYKREGPPGSRWPVLIAVQRIHGHAMLSLFQPVMLPVPIAVCCDPQAIRTTAACIMCEDSQHYGIHQSVSKPNMQPLPPRAVTSGPFQGCTAVRQHTGPAWKSMPLYPLLQQKR